MTVNGLPVGVPAVCLPLNQVPRGCWANSGMGHGGASPCNRLEVNDLGLCQRHLEELRNQVGGETEVVGQFEKGGEEDGAVL